MIAITKEATIPRVLEFADSVLRPKVSRGLNPIVVAYRITLEVHAQNGLIGYLKDGDNELAYVTGLPYYHADDNLVDEVIASAIETLETRLESHVINGWHGIVTLTVAISHGEATITTEVQTLHRLK